jgi:DNA-binding HxlR family transcriptional regulator
LSVYAGKATREAPSRAGALALSLLSVPLKVHVLQALEEEPRSLIDLRRAVGSPPQTTMRGHVRALVEIGAVESRRRDAFPGSVDYALGRPGRDLLRVAEVLRAWLVAAPQGEIELGSPAAKSAVGALVAGWSSTIVRALAGRPLSLTELSRLIPSINYPALERRLGALRLVGQIEARPGRARSTPYGPTDWLRRAIAPLVAGVRWERQHLPTGTSPVGRIDAEAAFLLAIPLVSLPSELSGTCRLVVEIRNGAGERRSAGVMVEVREGAVCSCTSRLEGRAGAWASGSSGSWTSAVMSQETEALEIGGDSDLAVALVDALHGSLFGALQPVRTSV